jgi:hypothetical protein
MLESLETEEAVLLHIKREYVDGTKMEQQMVC